ncbi:ferredoxin--NADP reductase [Eoetvoesiella caeni]|uniref:ferredoxin--NADP(+) reductase n=1 Tax=Eoetvoesiella caeni TaxID=645616 RepID=A0A366HMP7_9BURK|nr:ferredoxin--NADP reductase [Eoetvoesiella caeni]MCI2807108.1 ferredoxin--NADP reductase [Eoetvoesiella caeni]NYT53495.1 ferredoxin--NADP reductase [Eoetvoesiella caeni]RBP43481.1 ferredoxin--NADP+ reductase [Eoetvoesiella caeni]
MPGSKYTRQNVLSVKHWVADKLISLTTTRDPEFQFTPGQFARLGLPQSTEGVQPDIWRAYSMVNGPASETLEFYSIVVPEGEFSPRLAQLQPGGHLYVDKTAFGFLTLDRFDAGGTLWLIATGTGLSAYMSMLYDERVWRDYRRIILVHGVRNTDELAYRDQLLEWEQAGEAQSVDSPRARLSYHPIPTQQNLPGTPRARLTALLADGGLERHVGCALDPATSKVMLCGNPDMLTDARKLLSERNFAVGRRGNSGNLALENYW